MKKKCALFFVFAGLMAAGCANDLTTGGTQYYRPGPGVFICNEGNFMYGNASLSYYDPQNRTVDNQVFYNANNFPLGDVCQSMSLIDGKGFVVVNNSGKIFVIDPDTFKYLGVIGGLTSPRYIQAATDEKIYISDLYSPSLTIANPKTLQVTGHIYMGTTSGPGKVNGTEQMARYGRYVYVCSWSYNDKVYKIDIETDALVDSITVTRQPNSMAVDKNGKLWVLSDGGSGGVDGGAPSRDLPTLIAIDTDRFAVEAIFRFSADGIPPSQLCINGAGDRLYYLGGSWTGTNERNSEIHTLPVTATQLPATPFLSCPGRLFYALGVDPYTDEIYVGDAVDYAQRGTVLRYSSAGELLDQFKTDIAPGAFCFKKE